MRSRLRLIRGILERCAYIFQEEPSNVFQELHNRIRTYAVEDPLLVGILEKERQKRRSPWLRCQRGSLEVPGLVRVLTGHKATVTDCNFSPDGTRLVSGGADGALRVWNVSRGELLRAVQMPYSDVWGCDFAGDGAHLLALAGNDSLGSSRRLVVIDAETGQIKATSKTDFRYLEQCAVSGSGGLLALPGEDFRIELISVGTGEIVSVLIGHSDTVLACAFSPDDEKLHSVGEDGRLLTWELPGGRAVNEVLWDGKDANVCAFSPDLAHFVSGKAGGRVDLWRTVDGARKAGVQGHEGPVFRCFYTRAGSQVFSQGGANDLKLWDAAALAPVGSFVDFGFAARGSMSPDGRWVVTSGVAADYRAHIWDAKTEEPVTSLAAHTFELEAARFSPDGRHVVTASCDWTLILWDVVEAIQKAGKSSIQGGAAVTFSRDGQRLLSEHFKENAVRIWRVDDETPTLELRPHEKYTLDSCLNPDGGLLATTGVENKGATLKIWDSQTGRELWRAEVTHGWPERCAFSEDGRRILWEPDSRIAVKALDALTGVETASIADHKLAATSNPMSPDGRAVLLGDSRRAADGRASWELGDALVFWDPATGREEVVSDDGRKIRSQAVSPDGKILCLTDGEKARLIELSTRNELASADDPADLCLFSPDGRFLLTADSGRTDANSGMPSLRLRDPRTLALRGNLVFRTSEDGTGKCGLSPDGRLAWWASDERVIVFDLVRSVRYLFRDKAGGMTGVSFCQDSARFAVGNGRGEVIVFKLEFAEPGAPISTPIAHAAGIILRCAWCAVECRLTPAQLGMVVHCRGCGRLNAVNPFTRSLA